MSTLEGIQRGIFLPRRGIWVEWGSRYDDLAATADEASHWEGGINTEQYGRLVWKDECVFPFLTGMTSFDSLKGGVTASVRGRPLKVRHFIVSASDEILHRDQVFQYHLWMYHLTKRFGDPEVSVKNLLIDAIVPPCKLRFGPIAFSLDYYFGKAGPTLIVGVSHDAFPSGS